VSAPRVVAAIDFGTHGSGFAWAVVNETNRDMTQREIFYFDNWDAQQVVYPKNLSALLLDKHGSLLDWGYRARERMYLEDPGAGHQYMANYKMSLQQDMVAGTLVDDSHTMGPAEVSRLIELCIRQVYDKALEHIKAGGAYTEDDIAWCITVPAIWDEFTKDLMRKAAITAGLPDDDERLKTALEPEAAALYCIVKGQQELTEPGCRFLVIDAGGGTVDITSYQLEPGPRLSGLGAPTGDKAGSEYLNQFFATDVLCDRLGAGFVTELRAQFPRDYYDLMGSWDRAKRSVSAGSKRPITIPLPARAYAQAMLDGNALEQIKKRQDGVDTAIVIPADEVRLVFDKAVGAIIDAVGEQIRRMRAASGVSRGEIAVLVGGFAESPYLRDRLREYLDGQGVQMHVPPRPSVAVLAGAAHFAFDPSVIRARRSPFTYGISTMSRFRKGIDPESKLYLDDDGDQWCNDRVAVLVTRDGAVATDECVTQSFGGPLREASTHAHFQIVATKDKNPTYTTDPGVEAKASITMPYGSAMSLPRHQRQTEARLYFGDTRIRVEAENLYNGEVLKADIDWKPTW
jgi:hypothetical protein